MAFCEQTTRFKSVSHFGEAQLTNQVEANLKMYLDWAILGIGGWEQITNPASGSFGGDYARLRPSNDPSYTSGTVWEGFRKDWVWETGVNYSNNGTTYNPNPVTGVNISGVNYGTGSFYVDYPLGRIVLNTGIRISSTVKTNYCYRNVQVYVADQAPWWDELQKASYRVDNAQFLQYSSGNWSINPNHRVQLPAIVIEAIPTSRSEGRELGNGDLVVYQDILVHVVSEDRYYRNNILDWLRGEQEHTIHLIDLNRVNREGATPLDYRGMVRDATKVYPNLIRESGNGGYFLDLLTVNKVQMAEIDTINENLFVGAARLTVELLMRDV